MKRDGTLWACVATAAALALAANHSSAQTREQARSYENRLMPIANPQPLLADHPEFVEPVRETRRFEAPAIVQDREADLAVRAWRFSYNARGIVEMPNRLRGRDTAIIVVHPWGIDDGQGWKTPQPAGAAISVYAGEEPDSQSPHRRSDQSDVAILAPRVGLVLYSLPAKEDPIHKKMYRSFRGKPTEAERREGPPSWRQTGQLRLPRPASRRDPKNFRGPAGARLFPPVPRARSDGALQSRGLLGAADSRDSRHIDVDPLDVVIYDGEGYDPLRVFLKENGIRHVLLTGYNTDMCFCKTTAGYDNLSPDFNVFLVGDATVATFPANPEPRFATNAAISFAALDHLVTQVSWIKPLAGGQAQQ